MAVITGTSGPDVRTGGADPDSISGLGGNDTLSGATGADTILGGSGDDVLYDNRQFNAYNDAAADQLFGEDGNDALFLGGGDIGDGGAGDDTLTAYVDGAASLIGGAGNDVLRVGAQVSIATSVISGIERLEAATSGNAGTELTAAQFSSFATIGAIDGGGQVYFTLLGGGAGTLNLDAAITRVIIEGSTATESLTLAAGSTAMLDYRGSNSAGNATVQARGAADKLQGGVGADVLRGGAGDDQLFGNRQFNDYNDAAADRLLGEEGDDALFLGAGDTGDGGTGNDTLAASGAATLLGGTGNDRLVGSVGNDFLSGGAGNDTASYERATQAVTVSLAARGAQTTGGGGFDTLESIENLVGGWGNDSLTGSAGANVIEGGHGNDTLVGGRGNDTATYAGATASVVVDLRLGGAQDTSGAGIDTLLSFENLTGGSGDDTLTGNNAANVIEGGGGNDLLDGLGGSDTASYAGAAAAVTVSLAAGWAQNTVGAGIDTLTAFENLRGSAFGDRLTGSSGANRLEGLGGRDTLSGGAGADTLVGGAGNDTYRADSGDVIVEETGRRGGVDRVQTAETHTLAAGLEHLTLTGNAAADGTGNAAANNLTGNAGANGLFGLDGADRLAGGGGDDTLVGGGGRDSLTGGTGADIFRFNLVTDSTVATPDIILDFAAAGAAPGDLIDLAGIDANSLVAGDQAFAFGSVDTGGLSLMSLGTDTLVRANIDGDAEFEFALLIRDGAVLPAAYNAADFVL